MRARFFKGKHASSGMQLCRALRNCNREKYFDQLSHIYTVKNKNSLHNLFHTTFDGYYPLTGRCQYLYFCINN